MTSTVERADVNTGKLSYEPYNTTLYHAKSTSLLHTSATDKASMVFSTSADSFRFDKQVEAQNYIGIANSVTRLMDGALFFSEISTLAAIPDGIIHNGNSYFNGNLSSRTFSSGFAGSGWAIRRDSMTANIVATFDELHIRKRMRVYEMEVKRISATNGALWISDSFSGDTVEQVS